MEENSKKDDTIGVIREGAAITSMGIGVSLAIIATLIGLGVLYLFIEIGVMILNS